MTNETLSAGSGKTGKPFTIRRNDTGGSDGGCDYCGRLDERSMGDIEVYAGDNVVCAACARGIDPDLAELAYPTRPPDTEFSPEGDRIFLVWEKREFEDGHPNDSLVGVYRTDADAKAEIARLCAVPGFIEPRDGFEIVHSRMAKTKSEGHMTLQERCANAESEAASAKEKLRHALRWIEMAKSALDGDDDVLF